MISSAQNPSVKRLLALQEKSSLRRETGLFVVEGVREAERCIASGFVPETVYLCSEIARDSAALRSSLAALPPGGLVEISPRVYEKVAYRGGTEGVIAVFRSRDLSLDSLVLPQNPLVLVLEGVEKPGNVGALLRSADAAGADAVLVCNPLTDIYNPNTVRASLGALFSLPVCCCRSNEAIAFLKERGIRILTAQLQDSNPYYGVDMTTGTALVVGSEAQGLGDAWRLAADAHILIPMSGIVDSLNVSASAAILLFEAVRQRQEHMKN
ncbi:MAG: RNA methyltransferase [Bacteroidales bacterium]|nr:RNA methyltransferase [Bacteroidales bacterium]